MIPLLSCGLLLPVHEDVQVLVDVRDDSLALGADGADPERADPVGEMVEAGVPGRGAGLQADQVRRHGLGSRAAAPAEDEEERGDNRDRGDARGRERDRDPERLPLLGGAGAPLLDPALGRLDLPRRGRSAGLFRH